MAKTTTRKKSATSASVTAEVKIDLANKPKLPIMLEVLQFLRTAKNASDKEIHAQLSKALAECKKNDSVLMLERIMLHIGDVSRHHNILKEMGIKSATGGAQERAIFRSCMRWWEKNLPESFEKNLRVFVEFTLYENLMYYENRTDRKTGKILGTEILFPMPDAVCNFLASQIRQGKDTELIAKHLPKFNSESESRQSKITKIKVKSIKKGHKFYKFTLPKKSWVKVNGEPVTGEFVNLNPGDIISYQRAKQNQTLQREEFINNWIRGLCKVMGWTLDEYKKFRSRQATPEQAFCSKSILKLSKVEFSQFLDRLTSGQRFRVAKMLVYKDGNKLVAREKWNSLGGWYIDWENNQEKIADALRTAASEGNTEKSKELLKDFKVKSTGLQTIDILAQLSKNEFNDTQINNTYQSLVEKMDLIANVFVIVDGSQSMNRQIDNGNYKIQYRDIVYAMCIAFSTRNPIEKFRNTYGWFSSHFTICGRSEYLNNSPNQYVNKTEFERKVPEYEVISAKKTFTENFKAMKAADKQEFASTNMFANIEFFVSLVKQELYTVEELPVALLYLSDNENNTGKNPKEAVELANSIGWHPLQIFWGISKMPSGIKDQLKNVPNALYVGGFTESALSQILRGIKGGAIDPETELWSLYNDVRYSVLS